ncbi:MAG TPA: DUF1501 domain-containing protein [Planctomycetota bacterium]|nr:DUF1501 domain-containing protein [Planctomycetota bacterium]
MPDCECHKHLGDGWILESGSEPQAHREWQLANRRDFIKRIGITAAGLTCADFLGFFGKHGMADEPKFAHKAKEIEGQTEPKFLVYWFLEGGWESYDMFSPVVTPNNIFPETRLKNISDEHYRVLNFGKEKYGIYTNGNIRYGYLAEEGKSLFKDMAVLSSMETGSGHSAERLRCHMGHYKFAQTGDREDDERSVNQAFAEVYGQPYALPNLAWHYWLSDGELNEVQYTGRKGFYHALGPVHAHTIYAGTPDNLRQFLMRMYNSSNDVVNAQIQDFLGSANSTVLKDEHIEAVKSYASARKIYENLANKGRALDKPMLSKLFTDSALKEKFGVNAVDELITYRSVNGNKARTKFSPNTNVQAMMAYELMRAGLSCSFFIESRDIRHFDSHNNRGNLWGKDGKPAGQKDQTPMVHEHLWKPLAAFVDCLKSTEYGNTGKSLYDLTTIVLTSEFGRTIKGDVDAIEKTPIPDDDKKKQIAGQDISQHWRVTSAALLGGKVKGDMQVGAVGEKTLLAIPILPDGTLDPAYDATTGVLSKDRKKNPKSWIPDHGDIYATALYLSGIDPKGKGRNERGPLTFFKRA